MIDNDIEQIKIDLAIVKTTLVNHYESMASDIKDLKADVRDIRGKVERLFGVIMSRLDGAGGKEWKRATFMLAGWAAALVLMVLQYILKRGIIP